MPSKSRQSLVGATPADRARKRRDVVHQAIRIEGQLNGFWGGVAAILLLIGLAAVLMLGLLTLTVLLWIAFGVLLMALIGAVFRALSGGRANRPPRDQR